MKHKFDGKSLKFIVWVYFALFAAFLMLLLWFLQIFFLKSYYQEMKIYETKKIAANIIENYGQDNLLESISDISLKNDMYIHIETSDGTIIFSPAKDTLSRPYFEHIKGMSAIKEKLQYSSEKTVSVIMSESGTDTNTLAFGAYLEDVPGREVVLYIFSPLYPVESTVGILANQLVYVTAISMILALGLSIFFSRRITKPIVDITDSASKLAEGDFSVHFQGGNYSEISRLADTLNYTSKELSKASTLQKDLIANVSHDLRTPLTMIKSYAEMVRDLSGDNPEKRQAHLQVIIDESDRLNLLVEDLLTLSKMQSGVQSLHFTNFNLRETIENILNSYRILAHQEGFQYTFECHKDIFINGDEKKMNQVITNFINNAMHYSGERKDILLSLKETSGTVRFEITDYGLGIPEKEQEDIWQRYFRASTNLSRSSSGTGLGLSIVKEILILHHARFGVISKEGEGSTFWFELKKA
ncbi:MAG: sensor histidine kinase [Anaerovoracaceae bacterium]